MTNPASLTADVQHVLHAHLNQARENAQTLSPKIRPGTSLAALLERARLQPSAGALPTRDDLLVWQLDPAAFSDELHGRLCAGGMIEVLGEEGQGSAAHPCPRCVAERRTESLRSRLVRSGIPLRYLDLGWDDLDTDTAPFPRLRGATGHMARIIAAGDSLLLSGPPGSGKTQVAVLAAKAADAAGHTALVVNLGRLALDVREGYRGEGTSEGEALRMLISPTLLILDDLGAGETDTAAVERRLLYLALEDRQNARRPCVITTNLSPAELAGYLGARNLGRLQPLEVIEMKHGRNFRLREGHRSAW